MAAQVLVVVAEGESVFKLLQSDLFTELLNLLIAIFPVLSPLSQGVLQGERGGAFIRTYYRGETVIAKVINLFRGYSQWK